MKHNDSKYEPDASLAPAVVSTLELFVSDLAEASDRSAVISRRGNET